MPRRGEAEANRPPLRFALWRGKRRSQDEAKSGGFELVGGVVFIVPDPVGDDIVYRMQCVEIDTCDAAVRIPREAARRLQDEETRSLRLQERLKKAPNEARKTGGTGGGQRVEQVFEAHAG